MLGWNGRMLSACMLLLVATGAMSGCSRYEEYVPVVFKDSGGIVEQPNLRSPAFDLALLRVLDRYHEGYKWDGGKLLIRRSLAADRDLLANYTEKAVDEMHAATRPGGGP